VIDTCWNIGANVGEHVLRLARIVGPTGRVLAFEPNPEAAAVLATNIQLNRYSDRVSIVETSSLGETPNRSMKPTAPFRNEFTVLVPTPCRGSSPPR
jgi:FkbM family methyltransferase